MPFRYLINAASLLTVGNALSFKYEILYSGQRSASMTAAFFCWLYQPDIISHVNLMTVYKKKVNILQVLPYFQKIYFIPVSTRYFIPANTGG